MEADENTSYPDPAAYYADGPATLPNNVGGHEGVYEPDKMTDGITRACPWLQSLISGIEARRREDRCLETECYNVHKARLETVKTLLMRKLDYEVAARQAYEQKLTSTLEQRLGGMEATLMLRITELDKAVSGLIEIADIHHEQAAVVHMDSFGRSFERVHADEPAESHSRG
ncbi:hypothetical protein B0A54_17639 [Friedmanniomyces endolithicus]|uniref:Up-regulated during septation protein 1 domain-containing protein n=1 Tax=Friedmanniomyces endolithicus TaxID=329885 RepID=A0A4U0TVB1_9PEZI|nr:hypothetical protein LTS09_017439 [Friedmanniomyces endolithicus]TKA26228.1 hypothetical protein B0A54_17639 [Friedmanniomyces endolithicus]